MDAAVSATDHVLGPPGQILRSGTPAVRLEQQVDYGDDCGKNEQTAHNNVSTVKLPLARCKLRGNPRARQGSSKSEPAYLAPCELCHIFHGKTRRNMACVFDGQVPNFRLRNTG